MTDQYAIDLIFFLGSPATASLSSAASVCRNSYQRNTDILYRRCKRDQSYTQVVVKLIFRSTAALISTSYININIRNYGGVMRKKDHRTIFFSLKSAQQCFVCWSDSVDEIVLSYIMHIRRLYFNVFCQRSVYLFIIFLRCVIGPIRYFLSRGLIPNF